MVFFSCSWFTQLDKFNYSTTAQGFGKFSFQFKVANYIELPYSWLISGGGGVAKFRDFRDGSLSHEI